MRFPEVSELPARPGLPDPLVFLDGTPVRSPAEWRERRRPELKELFQHYMYGYAPPAPAHVAAEVLFEDPSFLAGAGTLKELALRYHPSAPVLRLLIAVPNRRQLKGRAPVFLGANFCGNHAETDHPRVALPEVWMPPRHAGVVENHATAAGRGAAKRYDFPQALARGYAVATFHCGELDPDRPDFSDGVHPHYFRAGQCAPEKDDWGTIAAWAWGVSRAVDYLVTDPALDPARIAVTGHSRLGKTALLAAAMDERIALAVPLQSGCGGAAPSRWTMGETVTQINERFPHWFNDRFPEFNACVDRLPFDQHALVALCAPRPVLFANAVEDTWANPEGQFEVLRAAEPVYRFLGAEGLAAPRLPELGRLAAGRLGYFYRSGKHSMDPVDWTAFLDYADRWLTG